MHEMIFALAVATAEPAPMLNLACVVGGSKLASATAFGPGGGMTTAYGRETVQDRVRLIVDAEGARIKVPQTLLPPLNGGGADGWWTLEDFAVTDESITGRFSINWVNKPVVRVDRRTGDMDIRGAMRMAFSGTCRPETTERLF